MGVVHTPVCGQFTCGDGTVCGQWYTAFGRPVEILSARTLTFTVISGPPSVN